MDSLSLGFLTDYLALAQMLDRKEVVDAVAEADQRTSLTALHNAMSQLASVIVEDVRSRLTQTEAEVQHRIAAALSAGEMEASEITEDFVDSIALSMHRG